MALEFKGVRKQFDNSEKPTSSVLLGHPDVEKVRF